MKRDNSVITILINCMEIADKLLSLNGNEKKELVVKQIKTSIGDTDFNSIGGSMIEEMIDLICNLTKNKNYLEINAFKKRFCPF